MSALKNYIAKKRADGETTAEIPDKTVATVAVIHGRHILMGKRRDNGKWTVPGGHANDGESHHQTAARELEEESGIKADHNDLKKLGHGETVTNDKKESVHVVPFSFTPSKRPKTSMSDDPDAEVHRWNWVDCSNGLPEAIKKNLHIPANRHVLFKNIGLL